MREVALYGTPFSLYTGRARSYLIKAGIPYREIPHNSRHFFDSVLPKAGGRRGVPTLEFSDGRVIRDGVAIVDHFENERGQTFSPLSPKQRVVSRLFDVIGAEGLLRPAMHYRWNFDERNLDFIRFHFNITYTDTDPVRDGETYMKLIREVVTPLFGAAPEAYKRIESLYLELLKKLNVHFSKHPYLPGGKPSVGDFGMIAPLYGHLGRDPGRGLSCRRSDPRFSD